MAEKVNYNTFPKSYHPALAPPNNGNKLKILFALSTLCIASFLVVENPVYILISLLVSCVIGVVCLLAVVIALLKITLKRVMQSIPVVEPTPHLNEKTQDAIKQKRCTLFRYWPELENKVAWVDLGAQYPTPVHSMKVPSLHDQTKPKRLVYFKREDMSHPVYGGNKVRTLEHQLACVSAAHRRHTADKNVKAKVYTWCGPGSNQMVATATHIRTVGDDVQAGSLMLAPEAPGFENGMNLLSSFTSPFIAPLEMIPAWLSLSTFTSLRRLLYSPSTDQSSSQFNDEHAYVMMPGGANPTGCLGHIGAMLELAHQIQRGELEEPHHIFLPLGSGCTTAGLLLGVAIARKKNLGMKSLKYIHSIPIHPIMAFGKGFMAKNSVIELVTLTAKILRDQLKVIDVVDEVVELCHNSWIRHASYAYKYGLISPEAEKAKLLVNKELEPVRDGKTGDMPVPFLCGTFSSKAMLCMLDEIETKQYVAPDDVVVFWATKSLVQPQLGSLETGWTQIETHPDGEKLKKYLTTSGINDPHDALDHPSWKEH